MKKSGFGIRLIVAMIGMPFILIPSYTGGTLLVVMTGVISLIALLEYFKLQKLLDRKPLVIAGLIFGEGVIAAYAYDVSFLGWVLVAAFLTIAIIGTLSGRSHHDIIATFGGIAYIPLLAGTLIVIRDGHFPDVMAEQYNHWILWCIWGSLWIGDTAAYLYGKAYGRHPLASKISPKKTLEGFIAGVIGAILFTLLWWKLGLVQLDIAILVGITAGTIGQFGDLVESSYKRLAGVKDVGGYLPGHGGLLDRFDSVLTTAPVVAIYLVVREHFWF